MTPLNARYEIGRVLRRHRCGNIRFTQGYDGGGVRLAFEYRGLNVHFCMASPKSLPNLCYWLKQEIERGGHSLASYRFNPSREKEPPHWVAT